MDSLYKIDERISDIIERMFESADPETGEIDPEIVKELTEMQEAREKKLDNIGAYMKDLAWEITAIKEEIKNLQARAKAKEKKYEWFKSYVASDLIRNDQTKFESARVKFSFIKSTAVCIPDESKVPKKYIEKTIIEKIDVAVIKKLLKEGQKVRGAELIERQNLQVK